MQVTISKVAILMLIANLMLTCILANPAGAGEPVDPLRRPEKKRGACRYELAFDYLPESGEEIALDELGQPFIKRYLIHAMTLCFTGTYRFDQKTLFAVAASCGQDVRLSERYNPAGRDITIGNRDCTLRVGTSYDFCPDHYLDPRVSLFLFHPGGAEIRLCTNILRDPVVFSAAIGYFRSLESSKENLSLRFQTGFIANDAFSMTAIVECVLPPGGPGPVNGSVCLRTAYSLDPEGNQELALRTTVRLQEDRSRLGLGLEWRAGLTLPDTQE